MREAEFSRLDQAGIVYLDYTGGGLYAARQITRHAASLSGGIFGNPHSANAPSAAAAFLAATATKVAVYLLLRFFFTIFGEAYPLAEMTIAGRRSCRSRRCSSMSLT